MIRFFSIPLRNIMCTSKLLCKFIIWCCFFSFFPPYLLLLCLSPLITSILNCQPFRIYISNQLYSSFVSSHYNFFSFHLSSLLSLRVIKVSLSLLAVGRGGGLPCQLWGLSLQAGIRTVAISASLRHEEVRVSFQSFSWVCIPALGKKWLYLDPIVCQIHRCQFQVSRKYQHIWVAYRSLLYMM